MLSVPYAGAAHVAQALAASGIDTRRWWGDGAHAHPATAAYPRSRLPVSEALARTAIGVPFYRDLAISDVQRIADAISKIGFEERV
jgi:dTDP-4-amino-4,6-dideoxygalactose transaminase